MADNPLNKKQLRNLIDAKLVSSGEKERLKQLLRTRLVECGWKDDLKTHAKIVVKSKGLASVTVDELVSELTPKARATVPESVRAEVLGEIRKFMASSA